MRITGINRVRSKGHVYLYDRKTGTRLTSDPSDPAAILKELEIIRGHRSPEQEQKDGTLGGLIAAYRASPEFTELADRTKADYQKVLDYLKPLASMSVARFNRGEFLIGVRDKAYKKHKRRFANYVVQVSRLLLTWGQPRGWAKGNEAMAVPLIRRPKKMARANRPWAPHERKVVLSRAPKQLRIPIALGMFAGAREGDAIKFPRSGYTGTHVRWTAGKNSREIWLRAHPTLRQILREAPKDSTILCLNSRDRSWTESGFRASFFKFIRELEAEGLVEPGLTFHGLRHTLGDLLGEAGCDTRDIAAVLGITEKMAEHYSKGADQRRRAESAMGKLAKLERKRK